MTLERWPPEWFSWREGHGCPMCLEGRPEANEQGTRFFAGEHCDAYLMRANVSRGYSVAIWRGRHVAEPTDLSAAESMEYWTELLEIARVLEKHYQPIKTNYSTNGNGVPHLHTQITLRYMDDPAPRRPFPWPSSTEPIAATDYQLQVAQLRSGSGP